MTGRVCGLAEATCVIIPGARFGVVHRHPKNLQNLFSGLLLDTPNTGGRPWYRRIKKGHVTRKLCVTPREIFIGKPSHSSFWTCLHWIRLGRRRFRDSTRNINVYKYNSGWIASIPDRGNFPLWCECSKIIVFGHFMV